MQVSRKVFGALLILLVTGLVLVGRYAPSATGEDVPQEANTDQARDVTANEESAEAGNATSDDVPEEKLGIWTSPVDEYRRGVELENQKKFDEAIEHYKQAIKIDPEYAEALEKLGKIFDRQGNRGLAIYFYGRALKIKQDEVAIRHFRRALGINDGSQQDVDGGGGGDLKLLQYVNRNTPAKNVKGADIAGIITSHVVGVSAVQPATTGQAVKKESLRYDGKSFDQWRKEFQTELKPDLRREALWAFGTFGANGYGAEVAEIIVQAMRAYDIRSIDGSAEGRLKQVAIDVYVKLDQKESVPALVKELNEGSRRGQMFAAHVLSKLPEKGDAVIQGLIDAALHEDRDIAGPALRGFLGLGMRGKVAVPRLVEALRDKGKGRNIRLQAMLALGSLGSYAKEAVPTLMEVTQDEDQHIAFRAIAMLADIGSPPKDAVPRLIDVVSDKESDVRAYAIHALGRIGPGASDAVPALIDVLGEKDPGLRWSAIEALGRIGPAAKEAVPVLRQALQDEKGNLHNHIDAALKAIEK